MSPRLISDFVFAMISTKSISPRDSFPLKASNVLLLRVISPHKPFQPRIVEAGIRVGA